MIGMDFITFIILLLISIICLFFPFLFVNLFKGYFTHIDDVLKAHFNQTVPETS